MTASATTFLTAARRGQELQELVDGPPVDVLVIGGGVTGCGVALDAATRGLSVALLERRDLANGTSRFSSKLVHGGLRYLTRLQFGVAWESARERDRLLRFTAPHLVRALPLLFPLPGRGIGPALLLSAGVRTGDAMRMLSGTSRRLLPPMRRIGVAELSRWAPALRTEGLRGGLLSWDGQLEDDARLVIALARTAAGHGARVLTYCSVERIRPDGADIVDERSGERAHVRARVVVNATGAWADTLVDGVAMRRSRGAHLLVRSERLGDPRAMVNVPLPGHFGRFVFAVPRPDGLTMIGITDEPCEEVSDDPQVSEAEERFLLEAVSAALRQPLRGADVVGRFAGLRPLLDGSAGATADLSRRHAVLDDDATGAVTIVGGKLTTYRRMAEDAVDRAVARAGLAEAAGPCRTARLPLVGAGPADGALPERLVRRFGAEAGALVAADPAASALAPLADGVPALRAEVIAAIEREGALTVEDVLDRRLRLDQVPQWRAAAEPAVRELLQGALAAS